MEIAGNAHPLRRERGRRTRTRCPPPTFPRRPVLTRHKLPYSPAGQTGLVASLVHSPAECARTGLHVLSFCETLLVAFAQSDIDALLARAGRMCAVCNRRHGVQVHHIVPRHLGGSDDASNAIPLCPNCHDEVHARYTKGRSTRGYTEQEMRRHLARTISLATRQTNLALGK